MKRLSSSRGGIYTDVYVDLEENYKLERPQSMTVEEIRALYDDMQADYEKISIDYMDYYDYIIDEYNRSMKQIEKSLENITDYNYLTKNTFYELYREIENELSHSKLNSKDVMQAIDIALYSFVKG